MATENIRDRPVNNQEQPPAEAVPGTTLHLSATKRWLMQQIIQDYSAGRSLAWAGAVSGKRDHLDILIDVASSPYECFVMGDCDNVMPDGRCGGHPPTAAEKQEDDGALHGGG